MAGSILKTIINYLVPLILGYCISLIKNYKKKLKDKNENDEMFKVALMTMLQSDLTNTYFVYENLKEIPDYIYKNWLNLLSIYEKLGGNDYIHVLAEKMKVWNIKKTDILK